MLDDYFFDVYKNNLDIRGFSQLLNDNAQGYKYYWLEAVIELSCCREEDISFDEIFNHMILNAWYSVTYYHLRLGPTVNGKAVNYLEHAVKTLNKLNPGLDEGELDQARIREAIVNSSNSLRHDKLVLCHYVPHRLLAPFFKTSGLEEGLKFIKNDSCSRLITYMSELDPKFNMFYIIVDGKGLNKRIRVNENWKSFLKQNAAIIKDWIYYNKVQFLQERNPGVPDIINKIIPETHDDRKLKNVGNLWKIYSDLTGNPLVDIYSNEIIPNNELSIDHFIPRSYISNDELWNLVPMKKALNSSKSNKLPVFEDYFIRFSDSQFLLYEMIFPKDNTKVYERLIQEFYKCKKHNLNSLASEKLFVGGHSEIAFKHMLKEVILPIYHSAELMGYEKWTKD